MSPSLGKVSDTKNNVLLYSIPVFFERILAIKAICTRNITYLLLESREKVLIVFDRVFPGMGISVALPT